MMTVVTMSCCPAKLRGDLTRWMLEIDTNVYVGNLTARVRDAVWERICENIGSGRATMVFSAQNEQKLDFRIHSASWEPTDYDGIKLVRRSFPKPKSAEKEPLSKAEIFHMQRMKQHAAKSAASAQYVVIDIETTGLRDTDEIIEIGAVLIESGEPKETLSVLVQCESIPAQVTGLTGITNDMIAERGIPLKDAMGQLPAFCVDRELVGYHISFDMGFLQRAASRCGFAAMKNKQTDVQRLSKKKLKSCMKYSLDAVAAHLGIETGQRHRAADDCMLTYRIYEKLKEN